MDNSGDLRTMGEHGHKNAMNNNMGNMGNNYERTQCAHWHDGNGELKGECKCALPIMQDR